MTIKNIAYAVAMALTSVLFLPACSQDNSTDPIIEDYESFISKKDADKIEAEPGEELVLFPKEPGDVGNVEFQRLSPLADAIKYQISLTFSAQVSAYTLQDPYNYSTFILQYIDEDNSLKIETLADGQTDLLTQNNGEISKTYTFTRQSGQAVYYALFYSPYGNCAFSIEAHADSEDDSFSKTFGFAYNQSWESFHITTQNIQYWTNAKAIILP